MEERITQKYPLISVGIPVYNEEKYLEKSLDSVVHQDYKNLEIIIIDNASTDRTPEICQNYSKKDIRIQYFRNKENYGSIHSFNKTLSISKGTYFMWASGHDKRTLNYISCLYNTFLKNPRAVVCYSKGYWINGSKNEEIVSNVDTRGMTDFARFKKLLFGPGIGCSIYGLFKSENLKKAEQQVKTHGPDVILMNELALMGEFIQTNDCAIYMRKLADYGDIVSYLKKIYGSTVEISFIRLYYELTHLNLKIVKKHLRGKTKVCASLLVALYVPYKFWFMFYWLIKNKKNHC